MAKRPKKFLMSKNSKIKGNSFVGMVSKSFEKIPKIIPINNIHIVFIICLLRGIGFSALLILFRNFFILYPYTRHPFTIRPALLSIKHYLSAPFNNFCNSFVLSGDPPSSFSFPASSFNSSDKSGLK